MTGSARNHLWHLLTSAFGDAAITRHLGLVSHSYSASAYRKRKCAENYNKWHHKVIFLTATSIMVISNDHSFRVPFDKIASAYFIWKMFLYFSVGNGQPGESALCQLYRHTFVVYRKSQLLGSLLHSCPWVDRFCMTRSNPTHQLIYPTRPNPTHYKWKNLDATRPNPMQLTMELTV